MSSGGSVLHVFDMDGTLMPGTTASLQIAKRVGGRDWLDALELDFRQGLLDTKGFAQALHIGWSALTPEIALTAFQVARSSAGSGRPCGRCTSGTITPLS